MAYAPAGRAREKKIISLPTFFLRFAQTHGFPELGRTQKQEAYRLLNVAKRHGPERTAP